MLARVFAFWAAACAMVEMVGAREVIVSEMPDSCPGGYSKLTSVWSCRAALDILGPGKDAFEGAYTGDVFKGGQTVSDYPSGCYQCWDCGGVFFNHHATGSPNGKASPICAKGLEPLKAGGVLWLGASDVDYWLEDSTSILSAPLTAHNIAVVGYSCQDVLNSLDASIDAFQPSVVVLVCGENVLASDADVDDAFSRFQTIVTQISNGGARVIMLTAKPGIAGLGEQYARYDAKVQDLAASLAGESSGSVAPLAVVDVSAGFIALGNPSSFYVDDDQGWSEELLSAEGYSQWNRWVRLAFGDSACALWRSDACVVSVNVPAPATATCGTVPNSKLTKVRQSGRQLMPC